MKPTESEEFGLFPSSAKETLIVNPLVNIAPSIVTVWNH